MKLSLHTCSLPLSPVWLCATALLVALASSPSLRAADDIALINGESATLDSVTTTTTISTVTVTNTGGESTDTIINIEGATGAGYYKFSWLYIDEGTLTINVAPTEGTAAYDLLISNTTLGTSTLIIDGGGLVASNVGNSSVMNNANLVINSGTYQLRQSQNLYETYASVTLNEGGTFLFYTGSSYSNPTGTLTLAGGTYEHSSAATAGDYTIANVNANATESGTASTLNIDSATSYSLTTLTGDGTLNITGASGASVILNTITDFSGTINSSDEDVKLYLNSFSVASSVKTFVGTVYSTGLTQTGNNDADLDVSFDTFILESGTYTKNGASTTSFNTFDASAEGASVTFTNGGMIINQELKLGSNTLTETYGFTSTLTLNASDAVISTDSMSIGVIAGATSASLYSSLYVTSSIQGATLTNQAVSNASIAGDNLEFNNVSFTNSSVTANTLTLNNISTSNGLSIITDGDSTTYSLTSLSGALVDIDESLTLNITLTEDQYAGLSENISFTVTGLTEGSTFDGDLTLNFSDGTSSTEYTATGSGLTGESFSFDANQSTIPESSSATLSLLALAGLMARRRRK